MVGPQRVVGAVDHVVAVLIAVAASIYISGYSLFATLAVVLLATIGIIVILKLPAAKDP